jgi:RNA polymerase Rpb1, domain 3
MLSQADIDVTSIVVVDHLSTSQQACYGYHPGYSMWHSKIHSARHLPGLEPGPEYFIVGARVGRRCSDTAIVKPKPLWSGKQIVSMVISRGINIHRSPDPKSSNPVFDDGMMVEKREIIFGIVEKKTVGASQGGLILVAFREKGPDATQLLFTSIQIVVNY